MISNTNYPVIIENFILKEDADLIIKYLSPMERETPKENVYCALGIQNTFLASKINLDNPIIQLSTDENINNLSLFLTHTIIKIRDMVSKKFNHDISLKQFNYVNMKAGSSNSLHFDSNNDGEQERQYAALIYLNDEYTGGEINFPDIDLCIKPKPLTLIFFKGDETLMHEVKEVLSGERKNILMFFGDSSMVSDPNDIFNTYSKNKY
jgi:hypothetical protein